MESTSNIVGNPLALIIERLAYLGIGIFLAMAIFTGFYRNLKENKNK